MNAIFEVILVIAAVLVSIAAFLCWLDALIRRDSRNRIYREAVRAGDAINSDHQAAKRAMNDAAGQSWRNLAD